MGHLKSRLPEEELFRSAKDDQFVVLHEGKASLATYVLDEKTWHGGPNLEFIWLVLLCLAFGEENSNCSETMVKQLWPIDDMSSSD